MIRSLAARASSSAPSLLVAKTSQISSTNVVTKLSSPRAAAAAATTRQFTSTAPAHKTVSITYVDAKDDNATKTVQAEVGVDLMNLAHDNNIELEGACGGELACSTCHLIFEQDIYDKLPEMEEEEVDMLDLAFEVTDTSRLGCQILVTEEMDGMTVTIPDDGF